MNKETKENFASRFVELGKRLAKEMSDEQLRSVVADTALPVFTRTCAQQELDRRQSEQEG